ncbi:MAG: tetratricopeptide repeat protein, partial [Xanthomonadales bacterium]|nr:tetratricopeptide repeat protein [Xanthomonadales bacterium]
GVFKAMQELIGKLHERKMFRIALIYVLVGWLTLQVADIVIPSLGIPEWGVSLVLVILLLGFPVTLIVSWVVQAPEPEPETDQNDPPVASASAKASEDDKDSGEFERTIAVLPLVNLSQNPEDEYFSDGMTEELINLLTRLPQLKVCSRTSSFAFKGKEGSLKEIAATLGVNMVLEGSVRRAGNRIRITAQLIDAREDAHLWSDTYDREIEDIFDVQDDIARSIVDVLKVTLSPTQSRAIERKPTVDVKAYEFYLRGRQFFHQITRRNLEYAKEMYERAISIDPDYGLAYAGLADCASFLAIYVETNEKNRRLADEASRKALEIAPHLAEAHAARGLALSHGEGSALAAREFEAAIALDPTLFEAYYFYGRDCMNHGNAEKAASLLEQARRVRPEDYQSPLLLGQIYRSLGRDEDNKNIRREGLELIKKHLELHPDDVRALYLGAAAQVEFGDKEAALQWLERALSIASDEPNVLYNVACVYSLADEPDKALDYLERAVEMGLRVWNWIRNDSDLDPLREKPRFKALLAQAENDAA